MIREAVIDGDNRYSLIREWGESNSKIVVFVLLNPSTADAEEDDQTTKVCIEFAKRWGFGSFEIVNLFAFRATDPKDLKKVKDYNKMVGEHNYRFIQNALLGANKIVVAWVKTGKFENVIWINLSKFCFRTFV